MIPIKALQKTLLAQRRQIFERVAHLEEDVHWFDTNVEPEIEEEGQEAVFTRLLTRLDERGRAEIEAIDQALQRIAVGDYGKCEVCTKPIAAERLCALPTATTCTACAAALEQRQGRPARHVPG